MKIRAWMQLFRVPTVWSAFSNIYAGYLIAGGRLFSGRLLLGFLASGLMIMAGMALNDVADRQKDALRRPNRPLPSGSVSTAAAIWVSVGMVAAGILLAGSDYLPAVIPAALLAYSIYLYDFINKSNVYGPLNMGMCRVFNLMLGLSLGSAAGNLSWLFNLKTLHILVSLGAYTLLITYLARDEVQGNSRANLNRFMSGLLIWAAVWFLFFLTGVESVYTWTGIAVMAGMAGGLLVPLSALIKNPDGNNTRKAVTTLLLLMPVTDVMAMLACGVDIAPALAAAIFIPLAALTGRFFYST